MITIERDDEGRAIGARCDCGTYMPSNGPGRDYHCEDCEREYNSSGQQLAPRSQWGEETGETAADFDAGVADPDRAFDDY